MLRPLIAAVAALTFIAAFGHADTVLFQLAPAASQAVTLYLGSDRCVVRETTRLSLPAGRTELRFRWGDANLDPATIGLVAPADVRVSGYRAHRDEAGTYAWDVDADAPGEREFTASYNLRGLTWTPTYELTFDAAAGTATLIGRLQLSNDSHLPLREARFQLCTTTPIIVEPLGVTAGGELTHLYADLPTVTVLQGWQRRLPFLRMEGIPARTVYRADPDNTAAEVRRILKVDLRQTPLPGALPRGHVEVWETLADASRRAVGADLAQVLDADTELSLGSERRLVFDRKVMAHRKTDFEFDRMGRVAGFDTCDDIRDRFRNHTAATVRVELIERAAGKWDLRADTVPTRRDVSELRWEFDLPAGAQRDLPFALVRHSGTRAQ
jgi:hypothetical protein